MQNIQTVLPGIVWVGVNDRRLARFENIFPLPDGISYNSYVILDDKTVLMDAVDGAYIEPFLDNVDAALEGRKLDYLVVTHVEPDHGAGIVALCRKHPELKIVANSKVLTMIGQFFEVDLSAHFHEIKEGDTLSLGTHTLRFVFAPMVHWPEVTFVYLEEAKLLFSADAFGSFGALNGNLFADEVNFEEVYLDEARRYYTNIVGKYGPQVQAVLKKLADSELGYICPLHGPVWRKNIDWYIDKYNQWSTYTPELDSVLVCYASMYGHTENAALKLAGMLADKGVRDIRVYDVSKTHYSYLISETFRYSHLVLAAPTYNMGLYLPMETFLHDVAALNIPNRKAVIIGNGSWAPQSPALMQKYVEGFKGWELLAQPLTVKSALKADQMPALEALANTIASSLQTA